MASNPRIKSVERATHKTWSEWLKFMESINAKNLDHTTIARKVYEELDGMIDQAGWWTQSVTVAYEQYIGRRIPGQRADGTFETSVSRSTKLSMKDLMDKWEDFAANDRDILKLMMKDARVSGTEKRMTWRTKTKNGSLIVTSEPKSNGTASIIVTQTGLQTNELNIKAKAKLSLVLSRFLESL